LPAFLCLSLVVSAPTSSKCTAFAANQINTHIYHLSVAKLNIRAEVKVRVTNGSSDPKI